MSRSTLIATVGLGFLVGFVHPAGASKNSSKGGGDKASACSSGFDGYKQVNTLLSHAFTNLRNDGTLFNLCLYNNGQPTPEGLADVCADPATTPGPNSCTRVWDNSEVPTGILAEAICTGKFKWCISETDFGDSLDEGYIVTAEKDNFLEGIQAGDLMGGAIPTFKALTIAMSKILHVPLQMELVVVPYGGDQFEDAVNAMAVDLCYATSDQWFRHPYRETKADFTCPTYIIPPGGFALFALESSNLDLADVFAKGGEGITICSAEGTTQTAVAERDFPKAAFVDVGESVFSLLPALCAGNCDATVDEISQAESNFMSIPVCGGGKTLSKFQIASPSSAGDAGAITYRAY